MSAFFICSLGLILVRAASKTTSMAPTARPSGRITATEGVTDSGEVPFEDDGGQGVVIK